MRLHGTPVCGLGREVKIVKREEPIDIIQEFVDQYAREEMVAFFDFVVEREAQQPVSGLCRIARPKGGGSEMHYLSLSFVADTPDDEARATARAALGKIDGPALRQAVHEVAEAIPVPSFGVGPESCLAQIDVLFQADPDRQLIAQQLIPAIQRIAQLRAADIVWWDAVPAADAPSASPGPAAAGSSLVGRLRGQLRHYLYGDGK